MILLFLFLLCCVRNVELQGSYEKVESRLTNFIETGVKPTDLDHILETLFVTNNEAEKNDVLCSVCRIVSGVALKARRDGFNRESLGNFSKEMCVLLSDFGYVTCTGYIEIILDSLLYIIDNKNDLTPERICAIRFQTNNCQDSLYVPWNIDIPPGKSFFLEKENSKSAVNIIHLTDIHYDPLYEPKSEAVCNDILCCQSTTGKPSSFTNEAGFWGDYRACDMPWNSVEDLLEHINHQHSEVEYVYFTGDIISHQVWNTSQEYNKYYISKMLQKLQDSFGTIPVYPILGNHESHPTDFYPPTEVTEPNLSIEWLFRFLAEEWSRWLPASTLETIRRGGYYTVLVKPGFRIIALNSNVCFTYNVWLLFNDKDPYGQLQWLSDTLLEAEKNEESVHILSHVPPGETECFQQWSHEFRRIIERFHGIISGQFNGHTHLDELKVFLNSVNNGEVLNVAFNGGSFTTFIGFNPSYRLYRATKQYAQILDYDQWTYNLSIANENPNKKPNWFKLYSFEDTYKFQANDLPSYRILLENMTNNLNLVEEYRRLQGRNSSAVLNTNCNDKCLHDILCTIKTVEYNDLINCQHQVEKSPTKDEL
ncbi:hypothetical protein FQR65_LT05516 [Abscondita terminalis]|nr:hypothetical protein FQR65_LT05516 [Abscondita terminalis]